MAGARHAGAMYAGAEVRRVQKSTSEQMQEEREANAFAMALLMPETMVREWCAARPLFTLEGFAVAFQVPIGAAAVRLYELQIPNFDVAE